MLSVAPEKAPVRPSGSSPPPPRVDPPPEPELPSVPSAAPQTAGMPATTRAVVAHAAPDAARSGTASIIEMAKVAAAGAAAVVAAGAAAAMIFLSARAL